MIKHSFYECIERENEDLKQQLFNKTIEFEGINSYLRKYEKCINEIEGICQKTSIVNVAVCNLVSNILEKIKEAKQ